jgi:hypothetical protein
VGGLRGALEIVTKIHKMGKIKKKQDFSDTQRESSAH